MLLKQKDGGVKRFTGKISYFVNIRREFFGTVLSRYVGGIRPAVRAVQGSLQWAVGESLPGAGRPEDCSLHPPECDTDPRGVSVPQLPLLHGGPDPHPTPGNDDGR